MEFKAQPIYYIFDMFESVKFDFTSTFSTSGQTTKKTPYAPLN